METSEELQAPGQSDAATRLEVATGVAEVGGGGDKETQEEDDEEEEDREIQEMERELEEMAEKIRYFRRTIPDRLVEALSSSLVAQRPQLPEHLDLVEGNSSSSHAGAGEGEQPSSSNGAPLEADQEMLDKLSLFRSKTASNMEKMTTVLERMNACIARVEQINGCNMKISSVFGKKRKL